MDQVKESKFPVLSHFHSSGWGVTLGYVRVNDCSAGLEPPSMARKGKKLLWKCDETGNFISFTWTQSCGKILITLTHTQNNQSCGKQPGPESLEIMT